VKQPRAARQDDLQDFARVLQRDSCSRLGRLASAGCRKVRQLVISARQRGVRRTLYWAAFGYLKPNRFWIFAKDVTATPAAPLPLGATYDVWDAERIAGWRHGRPGLPPELFQDAIDGVRACAVALVDGDIAGFIWVYRPGDASRLFDLGDGEAELNYGAVLPAYRRHGLFRGVLVSASAWLADGGYHTVYACVHATNGPSMRAFDAAGFRRAGTVSHFGPYRPKYRAAAAA
jgi:ribosomal protein S18 acetylase RimI-like enzyme